MKISVFSEEEIVKELGLITCERGVVDQRVRLLIRRSAQGISCSCNVHIEEEKVEVKVQEDEVEDEKRQMKSAKRGSKREQTITQAHDTWMG